MIKNFQVFDSKIFSHFGISKDNNQLQPGFALSINSKGENIYRKAWGYSNLEDGATITVETKFHIASLAKQLTAYLINILFSSSRLQKNDSIQYYLPNVVMKEEKIEILDLLRHESGLRDQWEIANLTGWRSGDFITTEDILNMPAIQNSLNFSPKSDFSYCNTGYTLLAKVIEIITGNDFRTYAKDEFRKLGLYDTYFYKSIDNVSNMALGYKISGEQYIESIPNFDIIGSTAAVSNLLDLELWANHLFGKIIQKKFKKAKYEDGLIFRKINEEPLIYHSGWDYGYSSLIMYLPKTDLSIIILSNRNKPNLFELGLRLSSEFSDCLSNEIDKSDKKEWSIQSGFFLCEAKNLIYKVSNKPNSLEINGDKLNSCGKSNFSSKTGKEYLFKNPYKFILNDFIKNRKFTKIENTGTGINSLSGTYFSKELKSILEISQKEDTLIIQFPKFQKVEFEAVNNDLFYSPFFTLKVINKEKRIISFSNLRVENIIYKRIC